MKKIYFSIVIFLSVNALSAQKGWKNYSFSDGVPYGYITDLETDDSGKVWIGANEFDDGEKSALAYFYKDKFKVIDNKEIQLVKDILFHEDTLWVLTDKQLFSYSNNTWEKNHLDTLKFGFIVFRQGMSIDQYGNKWLPTAFSGLLLNNSKKTLQLTPANSGIPAIPFTYVLRTGFNVWLGSENGFVKYNYTNWWVMNSANTNLKNNYIKEVAIDKNDRLWLIAADKDQINDELVFAVNNINEFKSYDCLCTDINEIEFDSRNKAWMILSARDLVNFTQDNLFSYLAPNTYDLLGGRPLVVEIDRMDNVWVATDKGISVYNEGNATVSNREILEPKNNFVYPNPVTDFLTLSDDLESYYEIYNIAGQLKQKGVVNSKIINTSTLGAGIYMLVVKGEKEFFRTKFIKQ